MIIFSGSCNCSDFFHEALARHTALKAIVHVVDQTSLIANRKENGEVWTPMTVYRSYMGLFTRSSSSGSLCIQVNACFIYEDEFSVHTVS